MYIKVEFALMNNKLDDTLYEVLNEVIICVVYVAVPHCVIC